jgi:hypothetical protein
MQPLACSCWHAWAAAISCDCSLLCPLVVSKLRKQAFASVGHADGEVSSATLHYCMTSCCDTESSLHHP